LRFFADHCVAESVCKFLEARGHEVVRLRTELPTDTPDPIVAKHTQDTGTILLSDDSDYDTIARRDGKPHRPRFRKLSRVNLKIKHAQAVNRLAAAITLIEFEYELAQQRSDKRMIIDVQPTLIRTQR
jgi:predicted nuclease of predicted toxin-antitoxin system